MRTFERNRQAIIEYLSLRLMDATDSRGKRVLRRYCRINDIPVTESDIDDMVSEAVRRRMALRIKKLDARIDNLRDQLIALNDKVDALHL